MLKLLIYSEIFVSLHTESESRVEYKTQGLWKQLSIGHQVA